MKSERLLSSSEMTRIASVIERGPYEGYPTQRQRLFLGQKGLVASSMEWYVPDGPWHISNHPNRDNKNAKLLDEELPNQRNDKAPEKLARRWRERGLALDQHDRPIHPDARQLLGDRRIGLPTGLGFFYRYGPNETVDAAVYRKHKETELLLIRRAKGGLWALPGGFVDREDLSSEVAARREAAEETGLDAIGGVGEVTMHKRAVGLRDTLHAWTENTVVLLHGDQEYLFDTEPEAKDDAIDVGWFTKKGIRSLDIFDAHQQYINDAFARVDTN